MPDKLRIGIIGANVKGWAGRAHLPALATGVPGAELVAVSTTRQESADEAAKMFGARMAFDHHQPMLDSPEVDAVGIVVKLPHHYQLAKDVIAAGKHIFVEWPLGTNTVQAEELRNLAATKGLHTAVGLQSHYSAEFRHMARLIEEGYIGEVLSVHMSHVMGGAVSRPSNRMWMRDAAAGANTLSITFAHSIYGLMTALGPIESFSALVDTRVKEWTDTDTGEKLAVTAADDVSMIGRLTSGVTLSVHVASTARQALSHDLDIHGTEGTLYLETDSSPIQRNGTVMGVQGASKGFQKMEIPRDQWVTDSGLEDRPVNVGLLWGAFADSIRRRVDDFHPNFADAVTHHMLIDAVQRASDTGQAQVI